jgi:predicted permease
MLTTLKAKLRALLRKSEMERELDEELRYHIEQQVEQNIRLGMSPEEARLAARKAFGGVEQAKERSRDARGVRWIEDLWQDLRYGARMLRKDRVFTFIAIATLALGIGGNTAIFSVLNTVLMRPLPGYQTDRLVIIREKTLYQEYYDVPGDTIREWRKQAQGFEQIEAGNFWSCNVAGNPPESAQAVITTAGYFSLYRVSALLGRLLSTDDERPGRNRVAVLDFEYWRRRFGGDPQAVGRTIRIDKTDYLIAGVVPEDFHPLGRGRVSFYLPLVFEENSNIGFWAVARLKPGVTLDQANAEMAVISRRLEMADPKEKQGVGAHVVSVLETWVENVRSILMLLFGAVTVVLMVACVNVANLLLARDAARRQEFAIRLALGASRLRLARQMAVESLLLALIGGGLGLLMAVCLMPLLARLNLLNIPRLDEVSIDPAVLAFNLLAALLTGVLCAIGPALAAARQDVNRALEARGRGFTPRNGSRRALIVAEIALTFALVYAAGLLGQSFARMQRVALGYDPRNALSFVLALPETTDPTGQQIVASYDRIAERIRHLPGVESVGIACGLPTGQGGGFNMDVKIEGRPLPPHNGEANVPLSVVSGEYLRLLRIPVLQGRLFDERDDLDHPYTAIISQSVARRFFPGQNPIGQRLLIDRLDPNIREDSKSVIAREIVGVVGDIKHTSVKDDGLDLLVPYRQNGVRFTAMAVRTSGDPLRLLSAIQREVAQEDKDLPVVDVKTLEERTSTFTAQIQPGVIMFSAFAALALLLSAVGIYGVMAYAVTQRRREIGVRMAMGAQEADVLRLIIGQGIRLTLRGVAIGVALALATTRLLAGLLYGVSAADPTTIALATAVAIAVALMACYLPARRATKVDPLVALKAE